MSNYASKEFWKGSIERAIRTAAQTAIALIGTDQVGILNLDWAQIGSVTATATLLSILMSIAGGGTGSGPSFTDAETIPVEDGVSADVVGEEAFFDDQDENIDGPNDEYTEADETPVPDDYEPKH
ncbi:holin [Brevibacterium aurantiacum]|uniref:holin n=1 Tax=Brevibacterium aurantiacum TaxID=273384 RepID=UPI003F923859